jgi:hypothetical protein
VTLNRTAPLGSPIEMTFKFAVAPDAHFAEDVRVMVHVVDTDEQMIFARSQPLGRFHDSMEARSDDRYTRTEFVPVYPYVGDASVQVGLLDGSISAYRLAARGRAAGLPRRAFAAAADRQRLHGVQRRLAPGRSGDQSSRVEWQWTKKTATMAFKNPKRDSTFYIDVTIRAGPSRNRRKCRSRSAGRSSAVSP